MKKILLILIAAQFIIAPQIIKGFGVNNSHEYLEVNQKKKTVKKDILEILLLRTIKVIRKPSRRIFSEIPLSKMKEEIKKLSRKIFWET